MIVDEERGRLIVKGGGDRAAYYLDGRKVRKGARLDVSDGVGGWISGRFEGTPLNGKLPTLAFTAPTDPDSLTFILRLITLGNDSLLRWPR